MLWYFPGDSYPKELQLEINLASADGVPQDLNVTGPYNGTVGFQEEPVDSYIYGIPGVMSILPTLLYSGGAEIISESPTVARTNFTSSLVNGSVHLDLVTPGNGYITGLWDGDYGSGVAIDPIASIRISPFITLAAVFSVDVTGMNRTLYQGFQAKAKSSYDFLPNGTDKVCTRTAYGYTIDTFNYNGFKRTLYDRQDPFISRCD